MQKIFFHIRQNQSFENVKFVGDLRTILHDTILVSYKRS